MKQRLITIANAAGVFVALLAIWQLVLWIFKVPPYMLPSPWAVARAVVARFPSLLNSFAITAAESAGGLIASIIVGVLVALFFAQSRWVGGCICTWISRFRPPPLSHPRFDFPLCSI